MIFIKSDEKVKKDKKKREKSITKIKEGLERIKSLINKYEYKTISYDERKIGELLTEILQRFLSNFFKQVVFFNPAAV